MFGRIRRRGGWVGAARTAGRRVASRGYSHLCRASAAACEALESRTLLSVAAPTGLAGARVSGTEVTLLWADNSSDETGFVVERKLGSGGTYSAVATPSANTVTLSNSGLTAGSTYYYRVKAVKTGDTDSAYSNEMSVTTDGLPNVPSVWSTADVGSTANGAGSADETGGLFTLGSQAGDMGQPGENFRYAYRQISGDATIIVRVASENSTWQWAKAGIMIRDSLSDSAKNAAVLLTPRTSSGETVQFQWRDSWTSFSSTTPWSGSGTFQPAYLKLVRSSNTFTGYYSTDGSTWTQVGSGTSTFGNSNVYIGLVVSSHQPGSNNRNTATYDNVAFSQGSALEPEGLMATDATGTTVNLAWTDHASNETGYIVEYSSNGGGSYTQSGGTLAANTNHYTVTGLSAGTKYTFRVKAVTPAGNLASNTSTAITSVAGVAASSHDRTHSVYVSWTDAAGEAGVPDLASAGDVGRVRSGGDGGRKCHEL
jgi:hypothetical protein